MPVQMVFVGTCTGGRVVDFHEARDAFDRAGGRLAPGVQFVLTPASREVLEASSLTAHWIISSVQEPS